MRIRRKYVGNKCEEHLYCDKCGTEMIATNEIVKELPIIRDKFKCEVCGYSCDTTTKFPVWYYI